MADDTAARIRCFVECQLQAEGLSDDADLVESSAANSLFVMQLVLFVEGQFKISVEDDDLDLANFRSIAAVTEFVRRKQSARSDAEQSDASSGI